MPEGRPKVTFADLVAEREEWRQRLGDRLTGSGSPSMSVIEEQALRKQAEAVVKDEMAAEYEKRIAAAMKALGGNERHGGEE